ncbi:MAG: hypothetical protein COA75_03210 [Cellvibrionales bacterium]|nr:MAG: hypothetical protein COA75_03210 [Cellvibrionales bacterium]
MHFLHNQATATKLGLWVLEAFNPQLFIAIGLHQKLMRREINTSKMRDKYPAPFVAVSET